MKKLKKVKKASNQKQKGSPNYLPKKKKSVKQSKIKPNITKEFQNNPTPHNTSQFLIANNSSSFYAEEDDESVVNHNFIDLSPTFPFITDILKTEELIQIFKNPNLDLELNSTAANSMDYSDIKLPLE